MSKSVNYLGLSLKNPIVVAAGPWSRGAERIQKAIEAGAGAVVTETITLEGSKELSPRIFYDKGAVLNTTLYSPYSFSEWEEELYKIDKRDSYIICNIRGNTSSEFAYIANRMERWGADALELTPFTPTASNLEKIYFDQDEVCDILRSVVRAVDIPVSVRLPFFLVSDYSYVNRLENTGVQGIVTTETLEALWGVDIEERKTVVSAYGGLSGNGILPVTYAAVSKLAQMTNCSVAALGGIQNYKNVLECIMLGADVVQMGSAVLLNGYEYIGHIRGELSDWMKKHDHISYSELKGSALGSLRAYNELSRDRKVAMVIPEREVNDKALLAKCQTACLNRAIHEKDGQVFIDRNCCDGCGLCVSIMPELFEMKK